MEVSENVTCRFICKEKNVSGKNSAYLAAFSNGSMNTDEVRKLQFRSYENSLTPDGLERKRTRKMLVADTGKLQYCGVNFGTQATERGQQNRYYIGVRNKRTGKMTIHGVEQVNCIPFLNNLELEDEDPSQEEKTFTEKMDILTKAFGSKRRRQAMESRLTFARGECDDGNMVADAIDIDSLKKSNSSANETANDHHAKAIPPQNSSATTPDEVYNIEDIISLEEYIALEPLAVTLTEATPELIEHWENQSLYAKLVLHNLKKYGTSLDVDKAKMLVYYNFIGQMVRLVAKDIKRKDPLPNVPEPFKRKLLDRFTVCGTTQSGANIRSMSLAIKDKAMTYALVLALFVENFRIDLTFLQADFKKSQATIVKLANALGCSVISQKLNGAAVKIAELKLPLFVPGKKFTKRR